MDKAMLFKRFGTEDHRQIYSEYEEYVATVFDMCSELTILGETFLSILTPEEDKEFGTMLSDYQRIVEEAYDQLDIVGGDDLALYIE